MLKNRSSASNRVAVVQHKRFYLLNDVFDKQGQSPTIRHLVMQAMADWYTKADVKGDQVEQQTKLSRILDVAQDLKASTAIYCSNCTLQ